MIANSILSTLLHLLSFDFEIASLSSLILFSLMTFAFSVYLSLKVIQYGSVWFACAWHAGWNWFYICGFGLPTTGITLNIRPVLTDLQAVAPAPEWLTGGLGGPQDSVFTTILLTLMCVIGTYQYLSREKS